jgi:hypothetical protein
LGIFELDIPAAHPLNDHSIQVLRAVIPANGQRLSRQSMICELADHALRAEQI